MHTLERVALTPKESAVLAKAVTRAAGLLEIGDYDLAVIIGVDLTDALPPLLEARVVERGAEFRAAVLFVRMFRSLDAIVGGNLEIARSWLKNYNTALESKPLEKIKYVSGLSDVVEYLDARRAII